MTHWLPFVAAVVIGGALLLRAELRYRAKHHNLRHHIRHLPTQTIREFEDGND